MKRTILGVALAVLTLSLTPSVRAEDLAGADLTAGMKEGKPAFKSMGPIAFGPNGILFIADTRSAAITAIATSPNTVGASDPKAHEARPIKVEGIDQKVAALLGTTPDALLINDMAVSPVSRHVYLAVSRGRGPDAVPVLLRVDAAGAIE